MSWEFNEDLITVEEVEDAVEPCIAIARINGKGYSLETVFNNPLQVVEILTGLANDIIQKELYGSDNRAYRLSRR